MSGIVRGTGRVVGMNQEKFEMIGRCPQCLDKKANEKDREQSYNWSGEHVNA